MAVGLLTVSFGSFMGNAKLLSFGIIVSILGLLYWVAMCIVSFINTAQGPFMYRIPTLYKVEFNVTEFIRYVCIRNRCPEMHWFVDTRWHNYGFPCLDDEVWKDEEDYDLNHGQSIRVQQAKVSNLGEPQPKVEQFQGRVSHYYSGCQTNSPFFIFLSVASFLSYLAFMIYGIITFVNVRQELNLFTDDFIYYLTGR